MGQYYKIKANNIEKNFAKKAKNGLKFFTGKGKENYVEKVTTEYIYFRSNKSKYPNKISRQKLREAIIYLLDRRMTTRAELERFSSFNSFLMGYLRLAFESISRIWRSKKGVLKLFLKGVKMHFAGLERDPAVMELVKLHNINNGIPGILMSYFHLRDDKYMTFKLHLKRLGLKLDILDSGEFSRYRLKKRLSKAHIKIDQMQEGTGVWIKQNKIISSLEEKLNRPILLPDYCDFILRHKDIIQYALNLDVTGDPLRSRFNANYMRSRGINPIEVWHAQSSFDELDYLVHNSESDFLAIGGTVHLNEDQRQDIIAEVFRKYPNYPFHILGCSSVALLKNPVFSADSSGPIKGRQMHQLITENGTLCADNLEDGHKWTDEECLAWNIEFCSSLEESYNGFQGQLIIPPALKRGIALTLF